METQLQETSAGNMGEPNSTHRSVRRRGPSKRARIIVLGLLGAMILLAIYTTEIEPVWIEVTRYHVAAPISPAIKIAHISDLHTRELGRPERRLLELLEQEKPDVLVITGDVTNNDGNAADTRALLERLHAPLGVWMVRGNWEIWQLKESPSPLFQSLGIHYLINESRQVREGLWIVGLDDPRAGTPDPNRAYGQVPAGMTTITLVHAPAIFQLLAGRTNLVLAGHTHGGQVRIPFLPPLWLPEASGPYVSGWYERRGTRMYVSRGVGMSVLPIRFLCRPELTVITMGN